MKGDLEIRAYRRVGLSLARSLSLSLSLSLRPLSLSRRPGTPCGRYRCGRPRSPPLSCAEGGRRVRAPLGPLSLWHPSLLFRPALTPLPARPPQTTKESRKKKERAAFEAKLKQLASGYKSDQVGARERARGRESKTRG